jgi:putative membrane protein
MALSQKQQIETAPAKPDLPTRLAIDRTFIAYERTMMAWTRTSASLITFGFTIYKFFQIEMGAKMPPARVMGPRGFGLTLVSIGLFSLLLAAIQNRRSLRTLTGLKVPGSMATLQAVVIAGLGIVALVGILLKG